MSVMRAEQMILLLKNGESRLDEVVRNVWDLRMLNRLAETGFVRVREGRALLTSRGKEAVRRLSMDWSGLQAPCRLAGGLGVIPVPDRVRVENRGDDSDVRA